MFLARVVQARSKFEQYRYFTNTKSKKVRVHAVHPNNMHSEKRRSREPCESRDERAFLTLCRYHVCSSGGVQAKNMQLVADGKADA